MQSKSDSNGFARIADLLAIERKTETVEVKGLRFLFRAPNDLQFRELLKNDEDNELWIKQVVSEPDMAAVDFEHLDGKFVFDLANAVKEFVMNHYEVMAGNES